MKVRDIFREPIFNLSNLLSLARAILLVPFVLTSNHYLAHPGRTEFLALVLLIFAVVMTDFLDGFLARRLRQETILGRYLDPICDKIATNGALVVLVRDYSFPLWIFIYYLVREIAGVWLGTFLYIKRDINSSPNWWGKTGVALVAFSVLWYVSIPYLRTVVPGDNLALRPELSAYALIVVLTGGIVKYSLTYWDSVFIRMGK